MRNLVYLSSVSKPILGSLLGGAAMLLAGWTAASLILRHVEDKSKRKTLFILFVVQVIVFPTYTNDKSVAHKCRPSS